ncbi:hypothetical protein FJZ53_02860 [Candidatus Woesearchaeota archaeon]|nr:hypothetical protein [Candidatus Woesearchaeota archaeon]
MKSKVATSEPKSKLKEFFKTLNWWKKIILLVLAISVIVVVWKMVDKHYYMKDGLCYSDFLENCEGKKVEVIGEIKKGPYGKSDRITAFVLDNINTPPCNIKPKIYFHKDAPWLYRQECFQSDYLYLGRLSDLEGVIIEIDERDEISKELSYPIGKTVKVVGKVFINRKHSLSFWVYGVVGIIPESITLVEGGS